MYNVEYSYYSIAKYNVYRFMDKCILLLYEKIILTMVNNEEK